MLILLVLGTFAVLLVTATAARRSRRRFRDSGAAIRCRLRVRGYRSATWRLLGRHWSRPMWAMWDGDALVVRRGPVLARAIRLRTGPPAEGVRGLIVEAPRWCGPRPIRVVLPLSDGSCIEMAASTEDRMTLVGPYLTAAIDDLPKAPVPRRRY